MENRKLNTNNDLSNPELYNVLISNKKNTGLKSEVYGCNLGIASAKEWFVTGRDSKWIHLDDFAGFKTVVNLSAKTYWKSSDYKLT